MPIIKEVIGTRRRKLTESDRVRTLQEAQARDEKLYTVRFFNIEQPGGTISFDYRGHGRTIYQISLTDGETCDLPLGLIMNMRRGSNSVATPNVRPKGSNVTSGESEVQAIDKNTFGLRMNGQSAVMDGVMQPGQHKLYRVEFVSSELEQIEKIWTGLDNPVKQMEAAPKKGPGRPKAN